MIKVTESQLNLSDDQANAANGSKSPAADGQEQEDDEAEIDIPEYELFPEGECEFAVIAVNTEKGVETPFGIKDKVKFRCRVSKVGPNGELLEGTISVSFNISTHPKSYLMRFLDQIEMPKPAGRFKRNDYLGVIGWAEVKHVTIGSGDTIATLQNFRRKFLA